MATIPQHVAGWTNNIARIAPAHGLNPVIIGRASSLGSRYHALTASMLVLSGTPTANTIDLFVGLKTNINQGGVAGAGPSLGTGAAITATSITRNDSGGSFILDGLKVDDSIILTGATSLGNNKYATITGVTATTLTFASGTFPTAEALPATTEIYMAAQMSTSTIAANAGNASATAALDLFTDNKPFMDASPERFMTLGPNAAYFASVNTSLVTTYIDLVLFGGRY